MEIPPHPLNGAAKEYFTYLSREDYEACLTPVTHEMSLRQAPFRAVASGKKVIEMRLYDPKRQLIRVGDSIRFTLVGRDESATALVVGLHYFPSFAELYAALLPLVGKAGLGYAEGDVPHPDDMLDYYSEDAIARFGVVGIEIEIRNS
jgi:ASC-1-like (ASCH) protein